MIRVLCQTSPVHHLHCNRHHYMLAQLARSEIDEGVSTNGVLEAQRPVERLAHLLWNEVKMQMEEHHNQTHQTTRVKKPMAHASLSQKTKKIDISHSSSPNHLKKVGDVKFNKVLIIINAHRFFFHSLWMR